MAKWNLDRTAMVVAGVGALNWGLVEFAQMDLVQTVAGWIPVANVATLLYGAVAAAGAYVVVTQLQK